MKVIESKIDLNLCYFLIFLVILDYFYYFKKVPNKLYKK